MTSGENIPESAKARHYKELIVWQRAMSLAKLAYQVTDHFPPDEKFELTSLIRRTAVSIPSSMAKGQARYGARGFLQHLSYPDGYWAELETQLLLSIELGFSVASDGEEPLKEFDELQRMLHAIIRKLASGSPLATRHSPLPSGEAKDSF